MRRLTKLFATSVLLTALVPLAPSASAGTTECTTVRVTAPAGAAVEGVAATRRPGGTVEFPQTPLSAPPPVHDVPAYCEVTVTLTHDGTDHVGRRGTARDGLDGPVAGRGRQRVRRR